jgi:hypothetical protein
LFVKPPDPKKFLIEQLERSKAAGSRPLLDAADLRAMYDMFDVTGSGAVTVAQANAALATALGGARAADAAAAAAGAKPGGKGGAGGGAAGGGSGGGVAGNPLGLKDAAARRLSKEEFVRCVGDVLIRATPNCQLTKLGDADADEEGGQGS